MGIAYGSGKSIKRGQIGGRKLLDLWFLLGDHYIYDIFNRNRIPTYDHTGNPCNPRDNTELLDCHFKFEDILPFFPIDSLTVYGKQEIIRYLSPELKREYGLDWIEDEGLFGSVPAADMGNNGRQRWAPTQSSEDMDNKPLAAREKRDYGLLLDQKKHWRKLPEVTIFALEFCQKQSEPVKKDVFYNALEKEFKDLPTTYIDRVREVIKNKYPHLIKGPGRRKST